LTEIADMAIRFLRGLIRFDTTNPPGNELPAAEYIAAILQQEGIEPVVLQSAPGRGNVLARLCGNGSAGALLLMSHIDVVPADPHAWDRPPFSAEVADGYVWGRGAVDTKQLTAMQLATMLTLKKENMPLKRDIVLAATADEEAGGAQGMGWLVQHHAEWFDCEYALNEGGGFGLDVWGQRFYVCQTGEKGVCWMKIKAHGKPGHGSIPHSDNAVAKLSAALARLSQARLPQHRTTTVERLVQSVASSQPFPVSWLLPLALLPTLEQPVLQYFEDQSELVAVLRATLHNTVSPTMLQAGQKINIIPSEAAAALDGRLMPGQQPEDLLREIRPHIGDEIEVEVVGRSPGYESEPSSRLFDLIGEVLGQHDPGSQVVPYLVPGGTDGRFLAERGVKVYGFSPARPEPDWPVLELAHGRNERISLDNIEFGTRVLYDVVRRLCA
jgi:acetylornithine deacetylase/succinyl-diaminopimelate desuccinylase-like protein